MDRTVVACQTISSLSIVFNTYLLYIYYRCPLRMINSYKYFFVLTAVYGIIFSGCQIFMFPVVIINEYSMVFVAIGPLHKPPVGQFLMVAFCVAFIGSLLIITNSFIYRYLQLCRSGAFRSYLTARGFSITILINALIVANWIVIVEIAFWPSTVFIEQVNQYITLTIGLDSLECANIGFSLKYSLTAMNLSLLLEMLTIMVLLAAVVIYSAKEIDAALKKGTISNTLRKLHRQMLKLLILQTTCPLILLHGPCFVACMLMFFGLSKFEIFSCAASTVLSLFPLLSPIIVIAFLKEYREHTLFVLGIRKRTTEATLKIASLMKIATNGTQKECIN